MPWKTIKPARRRETIINKNLNQESKPAASPLTMEILKIDLKTGARVDRYLFLGET